MTLFGLFKSKARVAKGIAEGLFASLGIDSSLNDVEQEIVNRHHVNEANYRSEKRILMAFAMLHTLHDLENADTRGIAKLARTEFNHLMVGLVERKPRQTAVGLILKVAAYDKALMSDEGGLMLALPSAFADSVDDMNEQARPLLISLGLVTFVSQVNAVNILFQECTAGV